MSDHLVASVALGPTVLLDVIATILLVRSRVATPLQKALQLMFTWAVPFVGSIIVIVILKETNSTPRARLAPGSSGDVWLPGIGPATDAFGGHHGEHRGGSGDIGHGKLRGTSRASRSCGARFAGIIGL
jgi:hypothetical protein